MATPAYASDRSIVNFKSLNGGLNTASGPLNLQDNESSDLQNIDFNKFGSILKRNGYAALNTSAISGTPDIDGLHWFEYTDSGATVRKAISVAGDKVFKMDGLDGTWDDISGSVTINAGNHCDFENFLNTVLITNDNDAPFQWTGTGNATTMTVPTGLTKAKFVTQFQNYTMLGNVVVSGTRFSSRFYWSTIKTIDTWNAADFIEVAKDDGQEITGFKVLGEFLIIFKSRSIYKIAFTGDRDLPFVVDKTSSSVGCAAPWSIQEVENGLVFLSFDGIYYFDGNNSFKISDRINPTILGLNRSNFSDAVSLKQEDKNRYWLAVTSSGQSENDTVIVWDWFNNSFSIYKGMAPSAMATFYIDGISERPYWGDYAGFVYRGDTGADDYPLNVKTAINAYYYTNWKHYEDLVDQKGQAHVYIYYQLTESVLTFAYSYDFEIQDTYTQTLSLSGGGDVYGTGVYGTAVYGGSGGQVKRRDLTGMGRVVRWKFANSVLSETFQVDGIGNVVNAETLV